MALRPGSPAALEELAAEAEAAHDYTAAADLWRRAARICHGRGRRHRYETAAAAADHMRLCHPDGEHCPDGCKGYGGDAAAADRYLDEGVIIADAERTARGAAVSFWQSFVRGDPDAFVDDAEPGAIFVDNLGRRLADSERQLWIGTWRALLREASPVPG